MPRYDLELVKQAAQGRWREVLAAVGCDSQLLDGRHHPCPKCGGSDRFRSLDDFNQSGAVICNQCFDSKNGDGLAAVQWLTGKDFGKSLDAVAKFLGVQPEKSKKTRDPFDKLEELPWNKIKAGLWCQKKPPITVEALERLGAKHCRYLGKYTVFAIPVWGPQLDQNPAVGWILYRTDGGKLPRYGSKGQEPDWVKVKLSEGSGKGIVVCLDDWKRRDEFEQWWKVEGSTDLLSAMASTSHLPHGTLGLSTSRLPSGTLGSELTGNERAVDQDQMRPRSRPAGGTYLHAFFTTANGAKEIPDDWILEELADLNVNVCHDADRPGQEGAMWVPQADGRRRAGWAPLLARRCKIVRNVQLPFPIEANHGPDIRDFFAGGASFESLLEIAARSEIVRWEEADKEDAVLRSFDNSKRLAEANLNYYRREQMRNLVFWRNEWYRYRGNRYERLDAEHLRVRVRQFIQGYFARGWKTGEDDRDEVRAVTKGMVENVVEDMKGLCMLSSSNEDSDIWIQRAQDADGEIRGYRVRSGPGGCVSLENKILSFENLFASQAESDYLLDHTPEWFSNRCLPYRFDIEAECPGWKSFLWQVFEDQDSIDVLQKWFGYLLLPDTSLEKMLYIIGPTRSGKGTIMKVMLALFGDNQVASPTLGGLISQYALHGLFGKTIAVIPDARLSRRADREAITERLLSLVANDPQDIERKYLSTMTGVRMNLRFTLFSNKLPELNDSTAAMVGRGIYLSMPRSFLGREDLSLLDRLLTELPGILNWAIVGRHRLQRDRRIQQPERSKHMAQNLRVMMAPVSQFFIECTMTEDMTSSVSASDLFEAWCSWASENAYVHKMTITEFERRAIDANPSLRTERVDIGGMTDRKFIGVKLLK